MANPTSPSPYERMGGHTAFTTLISTFYDGVRNDPELRALYPEEDLGPAEQRLLEFMEQYWGGPTTYSEKRGHPRLRMRHMPFAITPSQRDRWVTHMMKGVDAMGLPQPEDTALRAYLLRAADSLINTPEPQPLPWWKNAVVYQIYPRSFADANGDGIGDLPGITNNLHHIAELGVDAIWISPFYPSPMADAGYDVTNYRDIDPTYGTLEDLDNLINRAHQLGLKIIIDIVPNHTSSSHPWFQQALNAAPNSPERDRYIFRQGRGPNGELPPNNWESNFSGPAWTRTDDGSWYLHLFDSAQPDLNWNNPHVHAEFESILRYWCDRGIDGFRIDVAHGLIKADGLPDTDPTLTPNDPTHHQPMYDQDGVHDIYRHWRRILNEYNPTNNPNNDRILIAEAWVTPLERTARYVRPDEMHHSFGFEYLTTAWDAQAITNTITHTITANNAVNAISTWVLSNHDVVRHASRLGHHDTTLTASRLGIGPNDPQPDTQLGLTRARAATTLMLGLPGAAYLYQGEELGLPEATTIPPHHRQDPTWTRSNGTIIGRDGCRVPLPWNADAPAYGFNTTGKTWLPQPDTYRQYARGHQENTPNSTLELYRNLLSLRRQYRLGETDLAHVDMGPENNHLVVFHADAPVERIVIMLNTSNIPTPLPHGELLISSSPCHNNHLPGNSAAWIRLPRNTTTP